MIADLLCLLTLPFITGISQCKPRPFTIIVLPDTQIYSESVPEHFLAQTEWIVAQKQNLNVKFVLHEGDITNVGTSEDQWINARAAMSVLDGVVPYALALGNHDIGDGGTANTRDAHLFHQFFPLSGYDTLPTFGGTYDGTTLDNSYHLFGAAGKLWLVFALEFGPRAEVLEWANGIAQAHPNHNAIVVTHSFVYHDDTLLGSSPSHLWSPHSYGVYSGPGTASDGLELWNGFVRLHRNMLLGFSGHVLGDGAGRLVGEGDQGNNVYLMLANYQTLYGGLGFLRIVTIDVARMEVSVKTYSPLLGLYSSDPQHDFTFSNVQFG